MNYTPRYLGRGSWLSRRDPRLIVLTVVCFVFTAIQVWDLRLMLVLALISFIYYRSAGIPFRAVRRQWAFVLFFVSLLVLVNGVIAGGRVPRIPDDQLHVYLYLPLVGTPVSAESLMYALTQLIRFLAMAGVGFPLAFAMNPADFGATFARLGIPDRFAFAIDLTFRFIPSLAADLQTTIDAQRVRGMELDKGAGGIFGRMRRQGPILVPTVVNAIVGAEDTIDAMDLRAFGTGPRSWLRELRFDRMDRIVLVLLVLMLVSATIAGFTTSSARVWVPDAILPG
ncbi:MAG: Energy-coupling factor transporter transrane protein EcfT [Chloroflexi bacterium]|nr:Energy-coupling factor transporter transrane protein EcfT [Chloroflexota bacterium]